MVKRKFYDDATKTATLNRTSGIRPEYNISDKFSDEDIERAWREASKKIGPFVMPEEVKS